MDDQTTDPNVSKTSRVGIPIAILFVLSLLGLPIIGFIFLMASPGLGGLMIIAAIIAIQYPLMRFIVGRKK